MSRVFDDVTVYRRASTRTHSAFPVPQSQIGARVQRIKDKALGPPTCPAQTLASHNFESVQPSWHTLCSLSSPQPETNLIPRAPLLRSRTICGSCRVSQPRVLARSRGRCLWISGLTLFTKCIFTLVSLPSWTTRLVATTAH